MSEQPDQVQPFPPPAPPKVWDAYRVDPSRRGRRRERLLVAGVVGFTLDSGIWFLTTTDQRIVGIPLTDGSAAIVMRPAQVS